MPRALGGRNASESGNEGEIPGVVLDSEKRKIGTLVSKSLLIHSENLIEFKARAGASRRRRPLLSVSVSMSASERACFRSAVTSAALLQAAYPPRPRPCLPLQGESRTRACVAISARGRAIW